MPIICAVDDCERRGVRKVREHGDLYFCTWHPDRTPPPRKGDVYVAPEPEKKAKPLPAASRPPLASSTTARDTAADATLDVHLAAPDETPKDVPTDVTPTPVPSEDKRPTPPAASTPATSTLPRDVELLLDTAAAHPDATLARLAGHARANLTALLARLTLITQQEDERRAAEASRATARAAAEQAFADAKAALAAAEQQLAALRISPRGRAKTVTCSRCGRQLAPQGRPAHERHCTGQQAGAA